MRIVFTFIYLFNILLWKWEHENIASIYTDHALCVHKYSVTERHCTCDGDHETVEIIAFWRHNSRAQNTRLHDADKIRS